MEPIRGLDTRSRRGVLLLVVLSMLTLFMMLGVSYVVVTTRARKSARAFANNVVAATSAGVAEQALLDQAFLTVVRGSAEPLTGTDQPASLGSGAIGGESLLGDKYGSPTATTNATTTVIGRLTAASLYQSQNSGAFIRLTTQSLTPTPANSSALAGRVITLSLPGLVASTRVLQSTGAAASPTIVIAAGPTVSGRQLSVTNITAALANVIGTGSNTVIINGREFAGATGDTNEAWDGVDSRNPLLPGIQSEDTNGNGILDAGEDTNSNGSLDVRLVMASTTLGNSGSLPIVDNDSDGIADSRFVDIGLPPVVSPKGAVLLPRAAILVADLDGRLNLNVHGSGSDESTFDTAANRDRYPPVTAASGTTVPLYQLPRGLGFGPADVTLDRSLLFGSVPATNRLRVANATVAFSGVATAGGSSRDSVTSRFVPQIRNAEGRYGDTVGGKGTTFGNSVAPTTSAKPGVDGTNDAISVALDQWRCSLNGSNTALSYFTSPGRYGSPPDLKGLLKVWVDNTGQPVYYRPFWTGDPATASVTARLSNETIDDPYEINLSRTAGRGDVRNPSSATAEPPDSLFTPAELEGLLRFGDSDTMKLPRRLAAILGTGASRGRLAVTTESWDTPAITGDAWQQVINGPFSVFLNATGSVFPRRPQDLFSPETLQGHRMNLNRPFHDAPNYTEPNDATGIARRQAFARQLYCLLVAIATRNGSTMTLPLAEQLAQYAINVVDFRDADSVMTQFPYDPSFGTANTGWSPGTNNIVWGCERPEILITETWAWHNRRTEDLAVGGKVVDMPTDTADDNFDQQRRPQGAFFVELFSPWSSSASRYDSSTVSPTDVVDPNTASKTLRGEPLPAEFADNEDGNGNGALDTGEDLNGNGELDMRTWRDSSLNLAKTAPSNSPIWRLVTVRGSNAFGTDPVVPSATNAALSILDPSRPGSSASIDRAFYFAQPSSAIQSSTPTNSCFWQQSFGGKSPNSQTYVVVGTDAPFNPLTSGTAAADVRVFRGASGQPATITEPLAASDPYDVMMQAASPGNTYTTPAAGNNYVGSWASPIDQPLDADRTPPAGITSAPLLLAGDPQLMKNGTHENFAVVHLQRLANPTQAWNATSNPYLTIDSMTVDLTVVNTDSTDVNRDEPGTTGAAPLAYLAMQKHYGRGSSTTSPVSTERGGKLSQISGPGPVRPAHDIWSAAVDAASTPIAADNAESFRTDMVNTRAATPITPGVTAGTLNASTITFNNAAAHTLQRTPERFYDTANSRPYSFAWLFWGNRPFVSATELALVPTASPFTLSRWHTLAQGLPRAFAHLAGYFESGTPVAPWDAVGGRTGAANAVNQTLWHFVHVPSPFAGLYATVPNSSPSAVNSSAMTALGLDIFPLGQLSSYREPGRINVNTIADQRVWRGLFGAVTDRGDKPDPTVAPVNEVAAERLPGWNPALFMTTAGSQGTPCTSPLGFMQVLPQPGANARPAQARAGGFLDNHINEDRNGNGILDPSEDTNNNGLLDSGEDINSNGVIDPSEDGNGNGLLDRNDFRDTGRNAFFRYQTMNRITNNLTTRSNVFAIWVTIGYFDGNAPTVEVEPVRRNRAFFIFDRSIPVGYEPGKNHNVPDAVLLRRIIQ